MGSCSSYNIRRSRQTSSQEFGSCQLSSKRWKTRQIRTISICLSLRSRTRRVGSSYKRGRLTGEREDSGHGSMKTVRSSSYSCCSRQRGRKGTVVCQVWPLAGHVDSLEVIKNGTQCCHACHTMSVIKRHLLRNLTGTLRRRLCIR